MKSPHILRCLGRRVRAVIAEANYAQRRATSLALAYDRYLPQPDVPPASYAEFLLRTSGPLRREPPAAQRMRHPPGRTPHGGEVRGR
jgi:hypothetical protein